MSNPIQAKITGKGDGWIFFIASNGTDEPITEVEAKISQVELGYHPMGYGFYGFKVKWVDGIAEVRWKCQRSCD